MGRALEYGAVCSLGGAAYTLIEILWRGYSHWTMTLLGGACFLLVYISERSFFAEPLWKRCFLGSVMITLLELVVGFFVNMVLRWGVWDYSDRFFNLFGQICLLYSAFWFLLCIPMCTLCRHLRSLFGRLHHMPHKS